MTRIRSFTPFNIYDFYGYLFPGAILSLFTFFFIIWFSPLSLRNIMELLENLERVHLILGVVGGTGFIATVYFAGHVNGTLSHLLFDQTLLKKVVGYPVYSLLNIPNRLCQLNKAYNFYFILFINTLIVLPILKLVFPNFEGFPTLYLSVLYLMLLVVGMRMVISIANNIPQKTENIRLGRIEAIIFGIIRLLGALFNSLFCNGLALFEKVIQPLFNIAMSTESISSDVVEKFKQNIYKLTGLKSENIGSDNFWLPYIYIHRKEPQLEEHLSNWMNLYAFLKNLSFVAFFLCFEISFAISLHFLKLEKVYHVSEPFDVRIAVVVFGFLYISAWILAIRYWVIYRNYFTKYLIRSFSSLEITKENRNYTSVIAPSTDEPPKDFSKQRLQRRRRRSGFPD